MIKLKDLLQCLETVCDIIIRFEYGGIVFNSKVSKENFEEVSYSFEVEKIQTYSNGSVLIFVEDETE